MDRRNYRISADDALKMLRHEMAERNRRKNAEPRIWARRSPEKVRKPGRVSKLTLLFNRIKNFLWM